MLCAERESEREREGGKFGRFNKVLLYEYVRFRTFFFASFE